MTLHHALMYDTRPASMCYSLLNKCSLARNLETISQFFFAKYHFHERLPLQVSALTKCALETQYTAM
jgi:hypothetical protein